ncbi:nucleotidyltransferase family protein [Zobellia alginiliquefaciens]|uniref:nucleotidyltransferase family protein n=1 Tax=Zobellia alginiliquefaciens TaxID=3032586 RepID=UPI0023E3F6AB|nr:nucleotidyltransferase family protein [Zobellia alginiliquefaciens]
MRDTQHRIAIIILAAGASSRMGEPKQLLPWKNSTLLGHVVQTAQSSKAIEVVAILGANAGRIKTTVKEDVVFVENAHWSSGLGTSIVTGVEWLLNSDIEWEGILVMLADQPLIDVMYLNSLMDISENNTEKIVASAYKNAVGVPAIFPRTYVSSLLKLNEDFGAKHLLQQEQDNVITVTADHRISDIDTKEDYEQLMSGLKIDN